MSTFAEQLWNLPPSLSESTLHGVTCGLLCGAPGLSAAAYRRALIDLLDDAADIHDEELARFVELAAEDMESPDLGFEPLLGEYDAPLQDRLACLAQWAAGFTAGFEEVGGELDDTAMEAFDDILAIADVESSTSDDMEAGFDFLSVSEHLKVAVLMVHATATDADPEEDDDPE